MLKDIHFVSLKKKLEVPHAHVHLIPLNTMDNARFIEKVKLSPEEFEATAKAINSYL